MPRQNWTRALVFFLAAAALPAVAVAQLQTADPDGSTRALYKRPRVPAPENPALVELGRTLFWDERLSASGRTSCGTCHLPDLAWATRDAKSRNDSGKLTSRKSQPLIGLGHAETKLTGWDGRNASLEAQAKASTRCRYAHQQSLDRNPARYSPVSHARRRHGRNRRRTLVWRAMGGLIHYVLRFLAADACCRRLRVRECAFYLAHQRSPAWRQTSP